MSINMIAYDLSHCVLDDERVVPVYAAYDRNDKPTSTIEETALIIVGPYYHESDLDQIKPIYINADTTGEMNLTIQ